MHRGRKAKEGCNRGEPAPLFGELFFFVLEQTQIPANVQMYQKSVEKGGVKVARWLGSVLQT
eukprot:2697345-Rhodomonas_salina.1